MRWYLWGIDVAQKTPTLNLKKKSPQDSDLITDVHFVHFYVGLPRSQTKHDMMTYMIKK